MFNFEFVLVLTALPDAWPPSLEHSHYRPKALIFEGRRKRIEFDWSAVAEGDEVRIVWLGHRP